MEAFEKTVRDIFHLIAEYGITNRPLDFTNPSGITEKDKNEFLVAIHKGFRLGQARIIDEIIPLLRKLEELTADEKLAKKEKNKERASTLKKDKGTAEYQISILRHFADFIAWQIFKGQYYKARRFYSGDKSRPSLLHSNLSSVLAAVDQLHADNENNFALITDLTTFIDIGDILLVDTKNVYIIECKSGDIQRKIFEFLEEIKKDNFDSKKIDYSDKNEKFFQQTKRTLDQMTRGTNVTSFLNTEKGKDAFSNKQVNIYETEKPKEYFFKYLRELIEESKKKSFAFGHVDEVVYVCIFRDKAVPASGFLFKEMAAEVLDNYVSADYAQSVYMPLKEPLFLSRLVRK